ncbi:NADPH-dependent FMN reductase [Nitrospirillum sp. BR 11163]|uniref:NADPH-dependent FMN reductase n=1 Tax=Nitrospirillum sp. BR 11163 TaxID=3104323 RepID=UPI002AFF80E3|nr:NADPH-dependent FMN reductase [Nitrospirillum sp. BR 11163]MEA1676478.1 NADPH-dependent FMN reductase [Nitrospirillum sp. BR 11163]
MRILALSGSLRAASSNTAVLKAAALLAPAGVEVRLYDGMANLPHYNPDLDDTVDAARVPPIAQDLRASVQAADALLIACPEYAHGVPGVLKNALDWLVSGVEFPGKRVALINASPRAHHAQDALREILVTMSADLVEAACVALPLLNTTLDAPAIAADPVLAGPLKGALAALAAT